MIEGLKEGYSDVQPRQCCLAVSGISGLNVPEAVGIPEDRGTQACLTHRSASEVDRILQQFRVIDYMHSTPGNIKYRSVFHFEQDSIQESVTIKALNAPTYKQTYSVGVSTANLWRGSWKPIPR